MDSILLVEPDVTTSESWAAALVAAGHSVLTASRMREALRMAREGGIDVIVIALYDPRGGVVELARDLDALPDAPPIVLVSESPDAPRISAQICAARFLPKPCEPSEVVTAVRQLLWRLRPGRIIEDEPFAPMHELR